MTQEVKTETLGIVAKILAFLKLDDAGKIGKFFAKEVKKAETAIRDLKNNKTAIVNVYNSENEKRNDDLEDAKEALQAAYQAVTPEDVVNNDAMESFSNRYWAKVNAAQKKIDTIEERITEAAEEHEDALKEIDEQITKYEARIENIKKV